MGEIPAQIRALDGVWTRAPGEFCRVTDGKVDIKGNIKSITLVDGVVRIPKWRATMISPHRVEWCSDDPLGEIRIWHRVPGEEPLSPGRGPAMNGSSPPSPH